MEDIEFLAEIAAKTRKIIAESDGKTVQEIISHAIAVGMDYGAELSITCPVQYNRITEDVKIAALEKLGLEQSVPMPIEMYVPEPQVGAHDPCFANTPYCSCETRKHAINFGERCKNCNGILPF